jgi:hypothetical protein
MNGRTESPLIPIIRFTAKTAITNDGSHTFSCGSIIELVRTNSLFFQTSNLFAQAKPLESDAHQILTVSQKVKRFAPELGFAKYIIPDTSRW